MNKLIIVCALIFAACGDVSTSEQKSNIAAPVIPECSPIKQDFVGGYTVNSWRFKMDDHFYVGAANTNYQINGITHDPNCPCQK